MDDDTPSNWETPRFWEAGKAHDWRNYIRTEMRNRWEEFTPEQKQMIARNADQQADREEWD